MTKESVFKSPESRERFRAVYAEVLSRFPFTQQYVETAYGQTFVLTSGAAGKPPVVLLHGSCSNSVFMSAEVLALSADYSVHAVDIIGEAGNSADIRPELNTDDFALWLRDVLDALGIQSAFLIGNSLGGWMALKFATIFPERVSRLALIASAGLSQIKPSFLSEADKMREPDGTVPMSRSIIGEPSLPKEVIDFINLIIRSYNPIQELPVYTDEALKRLHMPVLFIDGENDVIIDAAASAKRLATLVPGAEIHLIPDSGHIVFNALDMIRPFLAKESPHDCHK